MSKRIKSSDVQLGESFLMEHSLNYSTGEGFGAGKEEVYARLKEKEFKEKLDKMLESAHRQAKTIIDEAKEKAAEITKEAVRETQKKEEELIIFKEKVREDARLEGAEAGYEEGRENARNEIYATVKNIETIAESSFKIKKEIILSAEREILELSIAVAERILKKQLEIKPEMINEIIKFAINELKDKDEIKIIINPALREQLYNFSEEVKSSLKGMKVVKIIEDKTIHADGAIIESPESRIDVRLETQIAKITEEIMKSFEEEPASKEIYEAEEDKNCE